MLSRLLQPGLFGAEITDHGQPTALHPEEAALVAGAGEVRRRDFALGRFCAHAALMQLGQGEAVIGKAATGAPSWPAGIMGSITHTKGYAAALAARAGRFRAIGLDAERIGGVSEALFARLFTARERAALAVLAAGHRQRAATLLFSAKECLFKTGLAGTQLSFQEIEVILDEDGFAANGTRGRFATGDGLVLTVLAA